MKRHALDQPEVSMPPMPNGWVRREFGELWKETEHRQEGVIAAITYYDDDAVTIKADEDSEHLGTVDEAKRRVRMDASERAFIRLVLEATVERVPYSRQTSLLFDLDQSLVSRKYKVNESASVLRASAVPLLGRLSTLGFNLGILTSRGSDDLRVQLKDGNHLLPIAPYLESRLLITADCISRPVGRADALDRDAFQVFQHLLVDEVRDYDAIRYYRDERGEGLPDKDFVKLLQLAQLDLLPEERVIVFDDREYAALINNKTQIRGIYLPESARAHF